MGKHCFAAAAARVDDEERIQYTYFAFVACSMAGFNSLSNVGSWRVASTAHYDVIMRIWWSNGNRQRLGHLRGWMARSHVEISASSAS